MLKLCLAAEKCDSLHFDVRKDIWWRTDAFHCTGTVLNGTVSFLNLYRKVLPTAILWGIGTAIGEIPPYMLSYQAAKAGARNAHVDHIFSSLLLDMNGTECTDTVHTVPIDAVGSAAHGGGDDDAQCTASAQRESVIGEATVGIDHGGVKTRSAQRASQTGNGPGSIRGRKNRKTETFETMNRNNNDTQDYTRNEDGIFEPQEALSRQHGGKKGRAYSVMEKKKAQSTLARSPRLVYQAPHRSSINKSKKQNLFERLFTMVKSWMFRFIEAHGFWGILVLAAYPNAAFDLCGICCGAFLMPFWEFFGATLIGKGFIKVSGQTALLLALFQRSSREKIFTALERILPQKLPFYSSTSHSLTRKQGVFSNGNVFSRMYSLVYATSKTQQSPLTPAQLLHHRVNSAIEDFQNGVAQRAAAEKADPRWFFTKAASQMTSLQGFVDLVIKCIVPSSLWSCVVMVMIGVFVKSVVEQIAQARAVEEDEKRLHRAVLECCNEQL